MLAIILKDFSVLSCLTEWVGREQVAVLGVARTRKAQCKLKRRIEKILCGDK